MSPMSLTPPTFSTSAGPCTSHISTPSSIMSLSYLCIILYALFSHVLSSLFTRICRSPGHHFIDSQLCGMSGQVNENSSQRSSWITGGWYLTLNSHSHKIGDNNWFESIFRRWSITTSTYLAIQKRYKKCRRIFIHQFTNLFQHQSSCLQSLDYLQSSSMSSKIQVRSCQMFKQSQSIIPSMSYNFRLIIVSLFLILVIFFLSFIFFLYIRDAQ